MGDFIAIARVYASARVLAIDPVTRVATMSSNAAASVAEIADTYVAHVFRTLEWVAGASLHNGDTSVVLTATSESTQRSTRC